MLRPTTSSSSRLDHNPTTASIVEALDGTVEERIWPYGTRYAGVICRITPASTDALAAKLAEIFRIGRLDIEVRGGNGSSGSRSWPASATILA